MAQAQLWTIKELSNLTGVSVRTLHHYDHVGLLVPSGRAANRYRWYAEPDLVKLQQILALKSFGFGLGQIKTMLHHQPDMLDHLQIQKQIVTEQVTRLQQMQEAISSIIGQFKAGGSVYWQDCITLIERYRMNEELKKTWAGKTLDDAQLTEYQAIYSQHPKEFGLWEKAIAEINQKALDGELGDPEGPEGERIVKIFVDVTKKTNDTRAQQRHLNTGILKSIKEGKIATLPLSPEGNIWLAKAGIAYWLHRWDEVYEEITKHKDADPLGAAGKKVAKMWCQVIADHLMGTSPELSMGAMILQTLVMQKSALAKHAVPPTPQESIASIAQVKLFFDPEAMSWIEQALDAHPGQ